MRLVKFVSFLIPLLLFSPFLIAGENDSPTVREMTAESDHILIGKVKEINSHVKNKANKNNKNNKNKRNKRDLEDIETAFTDIVLSDVEDLIGKNNKNKNKKYRIRYFGGIVPYYDEESGSDRARVFLVNKTPAFEIGETVLIFLQGNGRKMLPFPSEYESVFKIGIDEEIYTHDGIPVVSITNDTPIIFQPSRQPPISEDYQDDGSYTATYDTSSLSYDPVPRFVLSSETEHLRLAELRHVIQQHVIVEGKKEKEFIVSEILVKEADLIAADLGGNVK